MTRTAGHETIKENMIMMRTRASGLVIAAAVAGAGLLTAGIAACGTTGGSGNPAGIAASEAGSSGGSQYAYYRSMMSRYYGGSMMGGGGMMGGSGGSYGQYGWMMGGAGYRWMTGINRVPGWMMGGTLPRFMMGASTDPGKIMGRFWANAPGPRVTPAQAAVLGGTIPAGATVSRAAGTITFTGRDVRFTMLASPAGGPDETFRIAGLVNPTVKVPVGARVTITFINADPDMAHGLVITTSGGTSSWMPMMTARPAFPGSALWFLGEPTSAGMHAGTLTFTATTPGTYRYLCPVPGHARDGMIGTFTVAPAA